MAAQTQGGVPPASGLALGDFWGPICRWHRHSPVLPNPASHTGHVFSRHAPPPRINCSRREPCLPNILFQQTWIYTTPTDDVFI